VCRSPPISFCCSTCPTDTAAQHCRFAVRSGRGQLDLAHSSDAMKRRLLNLLTALSVVLTVATAHGCALGARRRPTIREDRRELSVLYFPPGRGEVVVPVVQEGWLLLTDAVTVNGQSVGWLIVDTGANWTGIDREAARRLGITAAGLWRTPFGDGSRDGLYRIERLDVAGMTLSNHVIGVGDLSSLASARGRSIVGVVGGDVLGAVPFTVDFARKEFVLHRRDAFRPQPGVAEHRLTIRRPRTKGLLRHGQSCRGIAAGGDGGGRAAYDADA
jgi:hypothetical protein